MAQISAFAGNSLMLAWDPSTDPLVAGYSIHYGGASTAYTNEISAGHATSVIIPGLIPGATYYFAATTYGTNGLESEFSGEVSGVVPMTVPMTNQPPTLNVISDLNLNGNAGLQTVSLSGITSGAINENQTLVVTAISSNPGLIPNPTVNYTSPDTTGSLTFTPVTNVSGTATITVTVNDGGASNNIVTRAFKVTVIVDHTQPTVQITSPKANQQGTNGVITMTGKAGDNVAVGAVYYSLNESGWVAASTASGWTNWTANLTLAAGTNTVRAYAVDTSGKVSTTNTIRLVYLVYKPLTVQIVGRGTVSPNYNGVLLAVNVNYAMKACALPGFAFTNWTGSVTTNNATVRFTMRPDLALTANFVDATRPTISVVTPKANQQGTNGVITMTGKAADNVAVGAVYYSLNESGWVAASTSNGWTNWTANLTLVAGTNTVRAYAVDTSGKVSTTNTIRLVYLVYKPLTVQIVGRGTVSPNYNGVLLAVNVNYAMKASALSGFGFTNWTGSVTTNSATVRFTMQPNLALTANFVDVTRPTLSIMTPRARQQWTNGVITMTGKAGDNVAVAAVYYSLNESGWVTASTANGWTNWTADGLVLVAGTNTLRAYAVDASGNFSTTSTVQVYDVEQDLSTNTVAAASTVAAVLESPAYTKGVYAFEVTGEAGFKYVVEASTNLVNWDPVLTNTAPFTFVDPLASQFNQRFYRSVSVP